MCTEDPEEMELHAMVHPPRVSPQWTGHKRPKCGRNKDRLRIRQQVVQVDIPLEVEHPAVELQQEEPLVVTHQDGILQEMQLPCLTNVSQRRNFV